MGSQLLSLFAPRTHALIAERSATVVSWPILNQLLSDPAGRIMSRPEGNARYMPDWTRDTHQTAKSVRVAPIAINIQPVR